MRYKYYAFAVLLCVIGIAAAAWMNYLAYEGANWIRVSTVVGASIGFVGFTLLILRRTITEQLLAE